MENIFSKSYKIKNESDFFSGEFQSCHLVIGSYNYKTPRLITDKGGIGLFVNSLRQHNRNCAVVVLMDNIPKEIKIFLKKNKVNYLSQIRGNIMYQRFIYIYEFIRKFKQFNKVLVCDMNDVAFQDDPFSIDLGNQLYYASEQNGYDDDQNSSSQMNMRWIKDAHFMNPSLPKFQFKKYQGHHVLCAGTIMGRREPILDYLAWYKKTQKWSVIARNDQALLNIYAYEIRQQSPTTYQKGKILTFDKIVLNELKKDKHGYFLNDNEERYAILHQFDRGGIVNFRYVMDLVEKNNG